MAVTSTDYRVSEPDLRADFGIVTALRDEMLAVLGTLGPVREVHRQQRDIRYYYITTVRCLDGSDQTVVCVLATEMGQKPALSAAHDLIEAWRPRHLILVGIAGGIGARGVDYGDVIVPRRVHDYEPGKLAPGGRRQRGGSYDASPKLQAAVESLAIGDSTTWASRIGVRRPGGRRSAVPRVIRDELASGEEVWADLNAQTVTEVLERFDKVVAVETEAAAVFKAADESPHKPDVLVVKGASDLVAQKHDRWRTYAARAAAAFSLALIQKVGGRWQSGGPVAEAVIELEAKRKAAQDHFNANEFEQGALLAEECIPLAQLARRTDLEIQTRLWAARAWGEHLVATRADSDSRERERVLARIDKHVRVAAELGAAPLDVARGRARASLLKRDGKAALAAARQAIELADHGSREWLDALIMMLQACWQLDSYDEPMRLVGDISDAIAATTDGDIRLVLAATWLGTLVKAQRVPEDEPGSFCALVREVVAASQVSPRRAAQIVGQVAAQFNRPNTQTDTLALCELGYELAERVGEPAMCCSVGLQAAEVASNIGDEDRARDYLGRVSQWIEKGKFADAAGHGAQWATTRAMWLAARGRILARLAGAGRADARNEDRLLQEALSTFEEAHTFMTQNRAALRGDVEIGLADLCSWWGQVARDLGQMVNAARLFRLTHSDGAMAHPHFAPDVAVRAWLMEAESLALAGNLDEAQRAIGELLGDPRASGPWGERARQFQAYLDNRIRPTFDWFDSADAQCIAAIAREQSLCAAVAEQVRPLIDWWNAWTDESSGPESELMDFWGRGGFARIAAAIRTWPYSAIAVDAVSTEEIERWARILCPLFDTVVVKWKGPIGQGIVMCPMPVDYGGPGPYGGHDFEVTSSTVRDTWAVAMGWANPLPREVSRFLASDAIKLVATGRLIVLPAPLVGCTQTAVGWTDNMLVDGLLGGVVNAVRGYRTTTDDRRARQRVVDLGAVSLPYFTDISLDDLASVLTDTDEWVAALRAHLMRSLFSPGLRDETWLPISALIRYELRDACRQLREEYDHLARKMHWTIGDTASTIAAGSDGGDANAVEPVTRLLRTIASSRRELAPWIPYWRFGELGGRLDWTSPIDNPSKPAPPDARAVLRDVSPELQSWLYPGTGGWSVRPVIVLSSVTA